MKRTYNLSPDTVLTVKRLVEDRQVAPTQDALVEEAITEMARRIRDADDTISWEQAASDPAFRDESAELDRAFRSEEHAAWDE